jgi:hypothetical protein
VFNPKKETKMIANASIPVSLPVWIASRLILTGAAMIVIYSALTGEFTGSNGLFLVMGIAAIILGWRK